MDEKIQKFFLRTYPGKIKINEPLGRYTTFKIGGPADLFFDARTTEELTEIVTAARKLSLPVFVLGGGTNILIGDKGIRGMVVKNNTSTIVTRGARGEVIGGKSYSRVYVEADSGVLINKLVRVTVDEGLAGLEMHLGLPGSVGGAVYMNSKWTHPDGYVGDAVYQAEILTPGGNIQTVPHSYFKFGYDMSHIQKSRDIVMRIVFSLIRDTKERLWTIANESIAYRRQTQPQGVFSAGCTFKNISKTQAMTSHLPNGATSAGFLVDHAGCKGVHIGDAEISTVHANFIINHGHATAVDVIQLIDRAKEQVKRQYGVLLEEEIQRIGEF